MGNLNKSLITRKKYNEIKKYDRQEMDLFLNTIYIDAYENGYGKAIDYIHRKFNSDEFKNILKSIKGFGNTKISKIIDVINQTVSEILE